MKNIFLLFGIFLFTTLHSQDLLSMLDEMDADKVVYTEGTFKTVRLINGYTSEIAGKNDLIFSISHRFGPVSGGAYELYGLDQSTIRFGFEYGITDFLSLGVGRSNFEKIYDGFAKFKIARQQTGRNNFPFTVTLLEGMSVKTVKWINKDIDYPATARYYYIHELFISRKFGNTFSVQLAPVIVHRNMVKTADDENTVAALGFGANYTINKWLSLSTEYYHLVSSYTADNFTNSLAVGVELETGGGHIFQIHLSNSQGMTEKAFIPENTGKWGDGDVSIGFNIIRVFN